MRLDIRGRQTGKTHDMVEWVKGAFNRKMFVSTEARRQAIINQYPEIESKVLIPSDIVQLRGNYSQVGIDDLDLVLMEIFRNPVLVVNLTPTGDMIPAPIDE